VQCDAKECGETDSVLPAGKLLLECYIDLNSVDKKNQIDVTFCILYVSSISSNVEQLLEEK
jgi:hypothetical protein